MSIFSGFLERIYYCIDNIKLNSIYAKIENFNLDNSHMQILVVYRLGRKNLLHRSNIIEFERNFFEKISSYDRYRLAKFSLLQNLINDVFNEDVCSREKFLKFIEEQAEHEQLF